MSVFLFLWLGTWGHNLIFMVGQSKCLMEFREGTPSSSAHIPFAVAVSTERASYGNGALNVWQNLCFRATSEFERVFVFLNNCSNFTKYLDYKKLSLGSNNRSFIK